MDTLDEELRREVERLKQMLDERMNDGLSAADRIVLATGMMRVLDDLLKWVTERRADAVYEFDTDPEREESISSVARRAKITPQALNRVAAITRAERGEL